MLGGVGPVVVDGDHFTAGAVETAHADRPRSFSIGSSVARSAFGTMIAPARNVWPPSSKSSSAASIFTSLFLNRNVTTVLSPVCSTTSTLPVPSMPPGAFASVVSIVIC